MRIYITLDTKSWAKHLVRKCPKRNVILYAQQTTLCGIAKPPLVLLTV